MDFRRAGLSPALSLLTSAFSLPIAPREPLRARFIAKSCACAGFGFLLVLPLARARCLRTRRRLDPAASLASVAKKVAADHLERRTGRTFITVRSATMPYGILSFGSWLEPRYIFAAGQLN